MKGFLDEVAADLYARYGAGISELTILFPSQRARVFFLDALSRVAERPLWRPEWLTIDELTAEASGLRAGDDVRMVTELYKIYSEYHPEPFDRFYFWGETLLRDFDTVDKYLIDADRLFRNISDLKELEADLSYLTPEQVRILRSFWAELLGDGDLSEEKRRFLNVWRTLAPVYRRFRERLRALGVGYPGLIQRTAIERLASGEGSFARPRRYVVAGFNALSECEQRLFRHLATHEQADFYWDYDTYYVDDRAQEAGLFMRDNLRAFPPAAAIGHDAFRGDKRLTVVAASSDAVQCKYVARIVEELTRAAGGRPPGRETAVVLTDENLLTPLLHALPADAGGVNVTMGYPLRQSLACTFVERLLDLQQHRRRTREGRCVFYHADVAGLLAHPYVASGDPEGVRRLAEEIAEERLMTVDAERLARNGLLRRIFAPAEGWRGLSDYLTEAVSAAAAAASAEEGLAREEFLTPVLEHAARLRNSLDGCDVEIAPEVYASLLRRTLRTLRIPFEGEPLEGLQVMGILETRNLDFEHVIVLSMTDDNFPGNGAAQPSFIPYNLRAGYGMPMPEQREGVYAYYFYRLIQRARSVWMLYCAHADEKSTGEPSRYIYQLDYESGKPLRKIEAGVDVNLAPAAPCTVAKDEATMRRLERFTTLGEEPAALSPTAFSRYVACPMQFYFHSVARIRPDDRTAGEVDNPLFGTILHRAAQELYERVRGEQHPGTALRALAASGAVERVVADAVGAECLGDAAAGEEEYSGSLLIVKDIVVRYLRGGVVRHDAAHDAFAVRGLEEDVSLDFPFVSAGRDLTLRFAGRADRIDSLDDGALRVVDYKTGTPHLDFRGIGSLFEGRGAERLPNVLQTLLYAMMLRRTGERDVEPALYYVREMHRDDYSPRLRDAEHPEAARYAAWSGEFEERVRQTLAELFDPAVPFRQCDDAETCRYCDFNAICRR